MPSLAIDGALPALEIPGEPVHKSRLFTEGQDHRAQRLASVEQITELPLTLGQRPSGRRIGRQRAELAHDGVQACPGGLQVASDALLEHSRALSQI